MAITANHLTTGSKDTTGTSGTTASVTPGSNRLVLAGFGSRVVSGTPNAPTVTGNGLTWVQVATQTSTTYRWTLFRALGASPSAGGITADFGGQTQEEMCWSVVEFAGVDKSGTDGSGAVVQSAAASGSGTALSVTLSAFSNTNNAVYGGFMQNNSGMAFTAGTGFTVLGQDGGFAPGVTACSEWEGANDTSVDCTSTSNSGWQAVGVEIAALASPMFRGS